MKFLSLSDFTEAEIKGLISLSLDIKKNPDIYASSMEGYTLAMILMKPSLRTKVSFDVGMRGMGGDVVYIDGKDIGRGYVKDEVDCLARYAPGKMMIAARVFEHSMLEELAYNGVPVINALSDLAHPCQALADLMTMYEKKGNWDFTVAYVGDGNNVCNELIAGCSKLGVKIQVATPKGYEPAKYAVDIGLDTGMLYLTNTPIDAVNGADFVYTDTWVSMGQEQEEERRLADFSGFQITKELLGERMFMHCMPIHRGQEVEAQVPDLPQSIILDQAENRKYVQNAVILSLVSKVEA